MSKYRRGEHGSLRKDDFQRSIEQDAREDAMRGGEPPRANIEALREVPTEPVQVTDFAINRPGHGVLTRCGMYPNGCGLPVGDPKTHVCTRGRYAGRNPRA